MGKDWDSEAYTILALVANIESPEEQSVFLDEACDNNDGLRQRVERLLTVYREAGGFLDSPAVPGIVEPSRDKGEEGSLVRASAVVGTQIGAYKILEEIGEGGFGVVYMAEQKRPVRRKVALKIIKPGMDSREIIARFEAEQQALAMMDHPNIARVLDAGTTDNGRPFFAMELVQGVPVTEFCDTNKMPLGERLELFVKICRAVQHAHQKGVIHRDIKPSNVMVTLHDGTPVPKVIDFGVAKAISQPLTEKTLFTHYGQMIGTPQYVSPEQAEMSGLEVDTRSDIYSLGVLLYELLTATTPITSEQLRASGLAEIQRVIREKEPATPSTLVSTLGDRLTIIAAHRQCDAAKLSQLLRGELDWIVMKALEKDRGRRYDTASAFANDIEAFLQDEPVQARPASVGYLLGKAIRKHRVLAISSAIITLILLIATALSIWLAVVATQASSLADSRYQHELEARSRESTALARAEAQERDAQAREYAANALLIQNSWEAANISKFKSLLEAQNRGSADHRDFEWHYWWNMLHRSDPLEGHGHSVRALTVSRDGTHLASCGELANKSSEIVVWNLSTRQIVRRIDGFKYRVNDVVLSPDGKLLISGSGKPDEGGAVKVWDIETGQELFHDAFKNAVWTVAVSADGKRVAAGSSVLFGNWGELKVWDWDTQTQLHTQEYENKGFWCLAFAPDGEHIAVGVGPGGDKQARPALPEPQVSVEILHLQSGESRSIAVPSSMVFDLAISPDGERLAASIGSSWAGTPGIVSLWDIKTGRTMPYQLLGHDDRIMKLAFSPDGSRIATASDDSTVKVWDASNGQQIFTLRGHTSALGSVAYVNRRRIVSGGNGSILFWDTQRRQNAQVFGHAASNSSMYSVVVSEDESVIAAGMAYMPSPGVTGDKSRGFAKIWDGKSGQELQQLAVTDRPVWSVALSPDDRYLAIGTGEMTIPGSPGGVQVWDWAKRQVVHDFKGHSAHVNSVDFSPDGALLASTSGSLFGFGIPGEVKVWDLQTGQELILHPNGHTGHVRCATFSPDGRYLAWGMRETLETATGMPSRAMAEANRGIVKVWDLRNNREAFTLDHHHQQVACVAFSSDGSQLASGSEDHTIKVWDFETRRQRYTFTGHEHRIWGLAFSPNGRRLVSASQDESLKVWDLVTGLEVLTLKDNAEVCDATFSSNGQQVFSACADGTVKLWDGANREANGKP